MKKAVLWLFVLVLGLALATDLWAFEAWQPAPMDQLRALPNNPGPPARKIPTTLLPPLARDGLIRRVIPRHGEKVVALTFDLCELATSTTGCDMATLAFLREQKIAATLFVGGKWMRTHEQRMRQVLHEPLFEIGNHAWSHGNCALLSSAALRAQVLWTQAQYELLREAEHLHDCPPVPKYFRLPYARCHERALAEIAALGLPVVLWDVVAERAAITSRAQAKRVAAGVVRDCKPGSIVLFHANLVPKGTFLLVQEVVAQLAAQGYRFVTVSNLLDLGTPVRVSQGYFTHPGDNLALDRKFGKDGTGSRRGFSPE